jgi:hypothetical protein
MEFTPTIAQMAFSLYLALFVVFLVQPSVAGKGGVSMKFLGSLAVASLGWVALSMWLVATDTIADGWFGILMWAVTGIIALAFLVGILWGFYQERVGEEDQKAATGEHAAPSETDAWARYCALSFWERIGHVVTRTRPKQIKSRQGERAAEAAPAEIATAAS